MNKIKTHLASITRVSISQIKDAITWVNLAITLFLVFLSMISIIVSGKPSQPDEGGARVIQAMSQGITYALFYRVSRAYLDKATLDRNRTAYLLFSKGTVAFGKIIAEITAFLIHAAIVIILPPLIMVAKGYSMGGINGGEIVVYLISALSIFVISIVGLKFCVSLPEEIGRWKWVLSGLWMLVSIGVFIAASVVTAISSSFATWLVHNKYLTMFLPFLNFTTPTLILLPNGMPEWSPIILVLETIIAVIAVWRPFSIRLKVYLTT